MTGKSLAEIAAFQWSAANGFIADQLAALAPERWMTVSYESLVGASSETLRTVADFAGVDLGEPGNQPVTLPVSRTALTPPHPDKWRQHEQEIRPLPPGLEQVSARIEALAAGQS